MSYTKNAIGFGPQVSRSLRFYRLWTSEPSILYMKRRLGRALTWNGPRT